MRLPKSLALLILLLIPAVAHPAPKRKGDGFQQAPAPGDGDKTRYANNTAAAPLVWDSNGATAGGTQNICIPFGEMVVLKVSGGGGWVGTFTLEADVTFPIAADQTGACYVTDPNTATASGRGACIDMSDGETIYKVVDFDAVYARPGAINGMCASSVVGLNGKRVFPSCSNGTDCTNAGAGSTCSTGQTVDRISKEGCAYVVGRATAAGVTVSVASNR